MFDYQGMVVLATNQIWWTWEVEDVFKKVQKGNKTAMKIYSKQLHAQLEEVVVEVYIYIHISIQIKQKQIIKLIQTYLPHFFSHRFDRRRSLKTTEKS